MNVVQLLPTLLMIIIYDPLPLMIRHNVQVGAHCCDKAIGYCRCSFAVCDAPSLHAIHSCPFSYFVAQSVARLTQGVVEILARALETFLQCFHGALKKIPPSYQIEYSWVIWEVKA